MRESGGCAGRVCQHASPCCTLAMGWHGWGSRCAGRPRGLPVGGRAPVSGLVAWLPLCRTGRRAGDCPAGLAVADARGARDGPALGGLRTGPMWHRDAPVTAGCHGRRMSLRGQHCEGNRAAAGTGPSRLTTCPASHMLVAALCSGAVRQWSGSPRGGLTAGRGWSCWPGLSRTPWLSFVGHAAHGTVQQPNPCPYPESTNT